MQVNGFTHFIFDDNAEGKTAPTQEQEASARAMATWYGRKWGFTVGPFTARYTKNENGKSGWLFEAAWVRRSFVSVLATLLGRLRFRLA